MPADPVFDPAAMLRVLNRHGVRYVVVGGLAVAAHGVVRATADLELVVARSWANATALAAALAELDAQSVTEPDLELTDEVLVRRADRRLATAFGELHLLNEVVGVPGYRELSPGELLDIDGEGVPVTTLAGLRRIKRAAGRAKDRLDLAELEAVHGPDGG